MLPRIILACVVGCCVLSSVSRASAQTTVVVLGMRSVEGDDDLANALTEQLRGSARAVEGWSVSSTAVSMAQMSLAHGCDELDAACLSDIAAGLQVSRVIYGTLRRTSAREDFAYAVTLSVFDAQRGEIAREIDDTIPQAETEQNALANRAARLIQRLASTGSGGSITIQANIPAADVKINDQAAGQTRDGALRLDGLQPGQYRIELSKPGYAEHVSTVVVSEGADTALTAVLSPLGAAAEDDAGAAQTSTDGGGGHHLRWLGWTLVGVGAASFVGFVTSIIVVGNVNSDPLYEDYRDAVARANDRARKAKDFEAVQYDVCAAAEKGIAYDFRDKNYQDVVSLCRTGKTFQVLQWVFGIATVVTSGAGVALLLTAEDPPDYAHLTPTRRFALTPSVGPGQAALSATLRF